MKVYGVEITEEQQAAAIERMKRDEFYASSIEAVLINAGVPEKVKSPTYPHLQEHCANRAADRLVRQQKKAGNIELVSRRIWRWIGK